MTKKELMRVCDLRGDELKFKEIVHLVELIATIQYLSCSNTSLTSLKFLHQFLRIWTCEASNWNALSGVQDVGFIPASLINKYWKCIQQWNVRYVRASFDSERRVA